MNKTIGGHNYAVVRNYSNPPVEDEYYVADSREVPDGTTDWLDGDFSTREDAEKLVKNIERFCREGNTFPGAVALATGYTPPK